jgi:hypothetical protein
LDWARKMLVAGFERGRPEGWRRRGIGRAEDLGIGSNVLGSCDLVREKGRTGSRGSRRGGGRGGGVDEQSMAAKIVGVIELEGRGHGGASGRISGIIITFGAKARDHTFGRSGAVRGGGCGGLGDDEVDRHRRSHR